MKLYSYFLKKKDENIFYRVKDFAFEIGCPPSVLSAMFRGRMPVSLPMAKRIEIATNGEVSLLEALGHKYEGNVKKDES